MPYCQLHYFTVGATHWEKVRTALAQDLSYFFTISFKTGTENSGLMQFSLNSIHCLNIRYRKNDRNQVLVQIAGLEPLSLRIYQRLSSISCHSYMADKIFSSEEALTLSLEVQKSNSIAILLSYYNKLELAKTCFADIKQYNHTRRLSDQTAQLEKEAITERLLTTSEIETLKAKSNFFLETAKFKNS
jgi:hypothetical protein